MNNAIKKEKRSLTVIFSLLISLGCYVVINFQNIINVLLYCGDYSSTQFFNWSKLLYYLFDPSSLIINFSYLISAFLMLWVFVFYRRFKRRILFPISFMIYLVLFSLNSLFAPIIDAVYNGFSISFIQIVQPLIILLLLTVPLFAYFITVMFVNLKEHKALNIVVKILVCILIVSAFLFGLIPELFGFFRAFGKFASYMFMNNFFLIYLNGAISEIVRLVLTTAMLFLAVFGCGKVIKYNKKSKENSNEQGC